jgi:Zn-dependent M16 (insulinase) family peptidase
MKTKEKIMKENDIIHGFKLLSIKKIDDINSTLYEFEHLKSGAQTAYIENEDTNCCFAIGFRTLPQDSTGVCHIIEHSTLCGSNKYPLKEPFVNLIKGSMSTFLNAFTAYDWTMYPFASQTPKDFDNILSIYCDAVFNPLSIKDPKPFLQEGWHLELLNKEDIPSYKGVVYNEMKGAMSSVNDVLEHAALKAMYKDSFYSVNSGGDPDVIPSLTYEQYKAFYKKHYTPGNALTYFYGKMDIAGKLEFLDKEYFSKYERDTSPIVIEEPKPLIDTSYEEEYEIGEDEELKDNTYMNLTYSLCHYSNVEELNAWQVLLSALTSRNDSPLKKALLDAKLGENVTFSIDDDKIKPALVINLEKTNHNKKADFLRVFTEKVKEIVKEGIDKELLLATINRMEFNSKEMDTGSMPKGLVIGMSMIGSFNYRTALDETLYFSKFYNKFRQEIDNRYFENLLEKYILNSNHYVEVVINPSKTLGKEKQAAMDKKMRELKASMTPEEIDNLIKMNQELLAYQNHVDTKEELATLPQLSLKDIPATINYLDAKKTKIKGISAITHTLDTNQIAYARLYFKKDVIKLEDSPYLILLANVLGKVPTAHYTADEFTKKVRLYLGELSFSNINYSKSKNDVNPFFKVSVSALKENIEQIPELVNEALLHSKFPTKVLKQYVSQIVTAMKNTIIGNGRGIAMDEIASSSSVSGAYDKYATTSLYTYRFYENLSKNFDGKAIANKLKELCSLLFTKKNAFISISGSEEIVASLKDTLKGLKLPRKEVNNVLKVEIKPKSKHAIVIPSGVSYNAAGGSLEDIGLEYNGKLNVLAHIVNYDYLWSEVRVKGGAYGCSIRFTPNNNVQLGTYRDPNVENSYKAFNGLKDYLKNFKVSKDVFNTYLIGAVGGFDSPMSVPLFIDVSDLRFLKGLTKKELIKIKKDMLSTKQDDIRNASRIFEELLPNGAISTVGNDQKIREYSAFDNIENL